MSDLTPEQIKAYILQGLRHVWFCVS